MHKIVFSIFGFLFLFFAFSGLASAKSQDVVNFNFENAIKRVAVNFTTVFYPADSGIFENRDNSEVKLNGASFTTFVQGSGGAGTYAPNANGWDSGMDTKYWHINLSTVDYKNLNLSSKQYGSATGPRDFKVQWSLDGSSWTDVAGSSVTVANNWSSGALKDIPLPVGLENQPIVHLRWIMTSNTSIGGGVVGGAGTNRFDDIIITGTPTDIASWEFEDAAKRGFVDFTSVFYTADDGLAQNKDISEIKLNGASFTTFVQGSGGAGTYAPNANGWDSGMDTKYWSISFSTTGYKDLNLSSKQYGSATGPRDFKVQWSLDGSIWSDVDGSSVSITTVDSWVPGVLSNISLPDNVEDQSIVHLRWIMTSNTSIGGGVVGGAGTNRFDDIFIGGRPLGVLPESTVRTGLIAYWPFDNDTNDYSGNNNHGINYGAVSSAGKVAGGYSFGALNAYIGAPQSATLNTAVVGGDFTMSFWGAFPANTDVAILSQSPGGGSLPKWMFAVQDWGVNLGYYSWGDDIVERQLAKYAFPTHTDLQHYTLVKRGNNYFLYKNANQVGYSLEAPIPLADLGMDFEIGRAENNFYYKDILDEVTIWGRALNMDEIEFLYNEGNGSSLIEYTLTYVAGTNGSIIGITPQTIMHGKDGTAVTALPDPGYYFVNWSDGMLSNPRTDLAVIGDNNVTANFAPVLFANCGDTYWYDGYGYQTLAIGTQCWFKENLKFLPSVVPPGTGSSITPYYYVYNYSGTDVSIAKATANYATHGVLYNSSASLTACPTGFRLATDKDYKIMEMFLGLSQTEADSVDWRGTTEGAKLKSNTLWNGTNESGFEALPSGFRGAGTFNVIANQAYFWTADEYDSSSMWGRALVTTETKVRRYYYYKQYGFSVRCVQSDYTLTYIAGANGSISGSASQLVIHGADGAPVTAVPDSGYHFVDWSDASTANPRTDLAVTGDITVTANFALAPPAGGAAPTPIAGGRRPGDEVPQVGTSTDTEVVISDDSTPMYEEAAPFTDIDGHWAKNYIKKVYHLGYIDGYEDNTFRPDNYITRAEAAKLIAIWYDAKVQDYSCNDAFYIDVRCTDWYGKYVIFLSYKGVLEGYGNNLFVPIQNVTRAEALKMLLYAKDLQNSDTGDLENPFSDVYLDNWFYNVVMIGYMYSFMQDFADSTFEPFTFVTRAEFTKAFADILL